MLVALLRATPNTTLVKAITCDWDCRITNIVLGCTGAAPDTYVQSTATWHRRPNVYFTNGKYLLGDNGMLYSRNVIGHLWKQNVFVRSIGTTTTNCRGCRSSRSTRSASSKGD